MRAADLPDPAVAARLLAWLARYEAAFRALMRDKPGGSAQTTADACFAALRLQQRARWPTGAAVVDRLGLCANDVLDAWAAEGRGSAKLHTALGAHARYAATLRMVLLAQAGDDEARPVAGRSAVFDAQVAAS